MIVTIVYVRVKSGNIEDFIAASTVNHQNSILEPGNLRFDFLQDTADPSRFVFYEAYESPESAAAHKDTAHYKAWRDAVESFMDEPRKGVKYHMLAPANPKSC